MLKKLHHKTNDYKLCNSCVKQISINKERLMQINYIWGKNELIFLNCNRPGHVGSGPVGDLFWNSYCLIWSQWL